MRVLAWAIRLALFVVLLAFSAKNTDPVTLRFYFDLAWQAPLVVLLLAFFAAGVALGLMATLGAWLAQRREIARLQRAASFRQEAGARLTSQPPAAEG
jgi:lipopolysaccharide assembly protein A